MKTQLQKTDIKFPTHRDFCDFIKIFREDKPDLPKWKSYPLYIGTIIFFMMGMAVILMTSSPKSRNKNYYPSSKYKKVIKVNWLGFKSYEYHEI